MLAIRHAAQRGSSRTDWLDSRHSFSFGDYYDPAQMGFSVLRVINEDVVAPGSGFGTHGHRDMEIISYVLSGVLEHRDSLGNVSQLRAGELQRMTAGTGVRHSEYNPSATEPVHFLQIWLQPERAGLPPGYQQQAIVAAPGAAFRRLVSPQGAEGSLSIHQDVTLYGVNLAAGEAVSRDIDGQRRAYLQVVSGAVRVNGQRLEAGDGAALMQETGLQIAALAPAEVLYFDLP